MANPRYYSINIKAHKIASMKCGSLKKGMRGSKLLKCGFIP
jgi:hypothetical protein